MKLILKDFQGNIKKTATVLSSDPQKSRAVLTLQGTVKALIELRPSGTITFRGVATQLPEQTVTMTGTTQPFHIEKVETNLEGKVDYQLATVEEGKQYNVTISNRLKQGNYGGFIKILTDLPQKPAVLLRVTGYVEGEIAVKPQTIMVGKLLSQQTLRLGKVVVMSNHDKPFHITSLSFDDSLIDVKQQPLPNSPGIILEITPKLENVSAGSRRQTTVIFESDLTPGEHYEVQVHVLNSGELGLGREEPDKDDALSDPDAEKDLDQNKGNKPAHEKKPAKAE